jgi:hypothetical protein
MCHYITKQSSLTIDIFTCYNNGVRHGFVPQQRSLDLYRLDTIAPNLYLLIDASEKLELSVVPVPRQITRAVESRAGHPAKGIGNEFLSRQRRIAEIPAANICAAEKQLTARTGNYRL